MFGNGATIIMKRFTTNSLPDKIHRVQRPAIPTFCEVGRGATKRVTRALLNAIILEALRMAAALVFVLFLSWISPVVNLDASGTDPAETGVGLQAN